MAVYYSMFLFLIAHGTLTQNYIFLGKNKQDITKKYYLIICWIVLSLIQGLRGYRIGTDTIDYVNSFINLDYKVDTYEPLSRFLVYFVHHFTTNPTPYLLVCSMFINGLVCIAIYKMSENIRESIFLYISLLFYFTAFNAVRQACAYSIVLLSLYYIRERKYIKYAICIVLAILFHTSAAIALLLLIVPVVNRTKGRITKSGENINNNNKRTTFIVLLVTGIGAFVGYRYFDSILELSASIFPMYEVYLYNTYRDITGGIQQAVVYSVILIFFVITVPNHEQYKITYMVPLSLAVVFAFASLKMAYIARFMYYFDITTIISIPYMIEHNYFSSKSKIFFKTAILITCIAFMFYGLLDNYMRVQFYKFFWQ